MHGADGAADLFEKLKMTALLIIPLGVLIALIFYFKNKALSETVAHEIDLDSLKEEMLQLAETKKAQRVDPVISEEKPMLDTQEDQHEIENERGDFDEFELVAPLMDFEDIESETMNSDVNEEKNVQD